MGKYYFEIDIALCLTTCKFRRDNTRVASATCFDCEHRDKSVSGRGKGKDKNGIFVYCKKIK